MTSSSSSCVSRAAARTGVREATVEFEFPLGLAERLRADGIVLSVDDDAVKLRRRAKSEAELAGIRRAQRAAEAAMGSSRAAPGAGRDGWATGSSSTACR